MAKYDMSSIVSDIRDSIKDERKKMSVGTGDALPQLTEKDFIHLPTWWQEATGVIGMPFGRFVLVAGDSDSGKTSLAIQAIKSALEQDCGVIYVETENKTSEKDFLTWGVDPSQLIIVRSSVAEEIAERLFKAWEGFKDKYPDAPLFVVVDSLGNTISMRDADIDLTEQSSQPGGKGKLNRILLTKMAAKMHEDNSAVLLISYTYDNMGSAGKTNAGGKSLNFFSVLTYQTMRKKWLERVEKGITVRYGAEVIWKCTKNHINKEAPIKEALFHITAEGVKYIDPLAKKDKKPKASDEDDG
jgi:RecA/RadA recombinase